MLTRDKPYRQRVVDAALQTLLKTVGAVVLEGPKTCGKTALTVNRGYLEQIVEVDLPRVAQRRRDPVKLRRLLQAVARSVGNQVSVAKLAGEAGGENKSLDRGTVDVYLDELARLKILEDLPAWNAHLRSRDALLQLPADVCGFFACCGCSGC